jgi:hypothetical protein
VAIGTTLNLHLQQTQIQTHLDPGMPIAAGDAAYRHLAWFMTPLPENIADVIIHIAIQYEPSPNPL